MRASDADRERVANIVREAAGDGRLTMEELDERLDAVYAAKTYAELEPITRDLPATGTAHAPVPAQSSAVQDGRIGGVASSEGASPSWAASPARATGSCRRISPPSRLWPAGRSTCVKRGLPSRS